MIDVAYLRVYRPAGEVSLPVAVAPPRAPTLGEAVLTSESQLADAWEVTWGGIQWRCPRAPRRRMLESVVAYQQATERYGVGMIDRSVAEAARRELLHIRTGVASPAPVLAAAWHPPLRWFLAFVPDDLAEPCILRASLGDAQDRVEERMVTMENLGVPTPIVDELIDMTEWMDSFDRDSMLELDYTQVIRHIDPVEAALDDTPGDMHRSALALEEGDLDTALSHYVLALTRWAPAQAIGISS